MIPISWPTSEQWKQGRKKKKSPGTKFQRLNHSSKRNHLQVCYFPVNPFIKQGHLQGNCWWYSCIEISQMMAGVSRFKPYFIWMCFQYSHVHKRDEARIAMLHLPISVVASDCQFPYHWADKFLPCLPFMAESSCQQSAAPPPKLHLKEMHYAWTTVIRYF